MQRLPQRRECIVKDDAIPLLEQVLSVDCLAVASPIYSMGITAKLKGLIGQIAQYIWARKFILKSLYFTDKQIHRHKGIFISLTGLSWDNVFDCRRLRNYRILQHDGV